MEVLQKNDIDLVFWQMEKRKHKASQLMAPKAWGKSQFQTNSSK